VTVNVKSNNDPVRVSFQDYASTSSVHTRLTKWDGTVARRNSERVINALSKIDVISAILKREINTEPI
jgi:hypothetical protein